MFKKLMYEKFVTTLNSFGTTKFQGGYLIGLYGQGSLYVVDSSTLSAFDYQREIVIPVSEEYFTETPSVHAADRSDYVAQYQIMFETTRETEVMTVMDEFRDYFFDNKQFTLDGYTVSIKTTRGEKQAGVPVDRGGFYVRFKINVYLTAIKSGYIKKDADILEFRLSTINVESVKAGKSYQIVFAGLFQWTSIGASANVAGEVFTATGDGSSSYSSSCIMTDVAITDTEAYQTFKMDVDTFTTVGNITSSNRNNIVKSLIANTTSGNKVRYFYNSTELDKQVYKAIKNKLDNNTVWDFKETFDGDTFEYIGVINQGSRVLKANTIVILDFDWLEVDI